MIHEDRRKRFCLARVTVGIQRSIGARTRALPRFASPRLVRPSTRGKAADALCLRYRQRREPAYGKIVVLGCCCPHVRPTARFPFPIVGAENSPRRGVLSPEL